MKRLIRFFIPPPQWRLPVILVLGILGGFGAFIFYVSNAVSYLSDDPRTCVNCHVMAPQYATWQRGSHGRVTTCNDCHVPQDNFFRTYAFKASDGMRHATMFTLRLEPQVIQIKEAGVAVVQENCIRCHEDLVHKVSSGSLTAMNARAGEGLLCWECHREVPHGRVNSLASTPYARVPRLAPVTPDWIRAYLEERGEREE
ncbi:MAG: cytochrome c nitrite reductase small subunit [Bacteroidota bacterium]|jgi:cytochrome c nitrite reductase small subunit|nr:cytochrome c nitrite reductase small subunit [Bacteroidota bacterium]